MRLSVIEASDRLVDLINPDKPEVFEIEDPLMGPKVSYSKSLSFFLATGNKGAVTVKFRVDSERQFNQIDAVN